MNKKAKSNDEKHMQNFLQYLSSVYNNCNQHLLEQGKKRDQVITFYIVLFSFVLTNIGNLDNDFFGKCTNIVVYIVLIVIGVIVLINLADLRSWHTQYLDVIYVINWVEANYTNYDSVKSLQDKMKSLMQAPLNVKDKPEHGSFISFAKFWLFGSTDNTIYTGVIFLVSLSILGIYKQLYKMMHLSTLFNIIIGVLVYLIFLVIMLWIFERNLRKRLKAGEKYNTWILSFDYNGKINGKDNDEMAK